MMDKLNLPIIKGIARKKKALTMDDYLRFVNFHLKYTFDRKAANFWKKSQAVNIPFKK